MQIDEPPEDALPEQVGFHEISVISGGVACILATVAIVALVPNLLRVQVK